MGVEGLRKSVLGRVRGLEVDWFLRGVEVWKVVDEVLKITGRVW